MSMTWYLVNRDGQRDAKRTSDPSTKDELCRGICLKIEKDRLYTEYEIDL